MDIICLCVVFQKLCGKVVNPTERLWLKQYCAETLCILEVWFPPSFWDIMSHLVIHLVDELFDCGLVSAQWMYPIERYLGVQKKNVPEGCMAEGCLVNKALGLCTEYIRDFSHTRCIIWDEEEERQMIRLVCEGKGLKRRLLQQEVASIHLHVVKI